MEYREIPEGSIEIQPGLWAELHTYTVGSNTRSRYNIYSAEGYCFYSLNVPENFDEDGNVRPANERVYSTFAAYPPTMTLEMVNADAVSLPVGENGEVIDEAIDPADLNRIYTETNEPRYVPEQEEATDADYQEALENLGVNFDE